MKRLLTTISLCLAPSAFAIPFVDAKLICIEQTEACGITGYMGEQQILFAPDIIAQAISEATDIPYFIADREQWSTVELAITQSEALGFPLVREDVTPVMQTYCDGCGSGDNEGSSSGSSGSSNGNTNGSGNHGNGNGNGANNGSGNGSGNTINIFMPGSKPTIVQKKEKKPAKGAE